MTKPHEDRTALSWWFPRLEAAGLPVPKTVLLAMPIEAQGVIWKALDGEEDSAAAEKTAPFHAAIEAAANSLGYPCFLRTDHTSNKHGWRNNCFLASADQIPQHVFNLCEFSECCDFMGLPWSRWAVREFLPTIPLGTCPRYGDMPICREFRCFVDGDAVLCMHGYWPKDSLIEGGAGEAIADEMQRDPDDPAAILELASRAGAALGGAWSVDILETRRGWMVTDCAEAEKSFHWPGCPVADAFKRAA